MNIGLYTLLNKIMLALMAGVTDRPFRQLYRNHEGEPTPRSVQIVGGEPAMMAEAAKYNVDCGADLIDINMGCPAKKVCHCDAGSALLKDEKLVSEILGAVVKAS